MYHSGKYQTIAPIEVTTDHHIVQLMVEMMNPSTGGPRRSVDGSCRIGTSVGFSTTW